MKARNFATETIDMPYGKKNEETSLSNLMATSSFSCLFYCIGNIGFYLFRGILSSFFVYFLYNATKNERERRSSFVKDKNHWLSLSIIGESKIFLPKLAEREKNSGGYQRRHG